MNEKRILIYLLILLFLLFSVLGFLVFEAHIQKNQITLLLEFEKFQGRMYNLYTSGADLDDQMTPNIPGFAFYNYYGEPLYLHGTADVLIEESSTIPYFNKERNSVIIQRDMLNPFIPMFGNQKALDDYNQEFTQLIANQSPEYREEMVRYFYMEISDPRIYLIINRFRLFQYLTPMIPILLILFIWHIYTRNMSYRKQIEEQERLVVLGTAARTLTHEIKNPLSSIRLQSTIIKRSGCGLHEPSLKIINEEVTRLSLLTERVGDFLRTPEGTPAVHDLNQDVRHIMERYSHQLSYISNDEPYLVNIDPDRFRSIIENLLNNALQSGSETDNINIDLEKDGSNILLKVEDKGEGIPPENIENLYDPFFTTKSTGSGIGLAVVHSFVTAASGELQIDSVPGKGTKVTIIFPAAGEA